MVSIKGGYKCWVKFHQTIFWNTFVIFPSESMAWHVTRNLKPYFLVKPEGKYTHFIICWISPESVNFYPLFSWWQIDIFFWFCPENRIWHFVQIVICMKWQGPFSGKNKKKISKCLLVSIIPVTYHKWYQEHRESNQCRCCMTSCQNDLLIYPKES